MILVTGGSGFVGGHVVKALRARGDAVRCLVRTGSATAHLEALGADLAHGDLTHPGSLASALRGVATLYHCAADYRLDAPKPRELYRVNVDGTENVLRAAAEAGVARVVYTSTVGTLGHEPDGRPATEETPVHRRDMIGHYKRSKFDAERVAERWARDGLPVVIVNPSTPVGEEDRKPTPTGRVIVDFLRRRIPFYVDTGLNLVDVRDVAAGHILAAERGRVGQRYILGHHDFTLKAILDLLAEITGLPAPRRGLPHWATTAVAAATTTAAHLVGRTPHIGLEGVRMARKKMFFDSTKAVRELGLPQSPVDAALRRAVTWFQAARP